MCGEETPSSTPRIGARVDFFPAAGLTPMHLPVGNLLFLDPTAPSSSHATHVRFQQPLPLAVHPDDTVLVSIQCVTVPVLPAMPFSACRLLRHPFTEQDH